MTVTAETPFITRRQAWAETAVIIRGRATLARAWEFLDRTVAGDFRKPGYGRTAISQATHGLRESLEVYDAIQHGQIAPTAEFQDLEAGHPDDVLAQALERVAEDVRLWAGALVLVVAEQCGDESAAYVRGSEGGE
jgi:hypothetical protein